MYCDHPHYVHMLICFYFLFVMVRVRNMVFIATINNISVISLRSVLLVENLPQLTVKLLSHNAVSCTHHQSGIQTHVGDDKHRLHICKSNYHTITTTTVPVCYEISLILSNITFSGCDVWGRDVTTSFTDCSVKTFLSFNSTQS